MLDTLKEFADQPLSFEIDTEENYSVIIHSENGKYTIVGESGEEFPKIPEVLDDHKTVQVPAELLHKGINKTIFATANDEMRPIMNGVYIELSLETMVFVASDSHKLVRYRRYDAKSEHEGSFVLPKKPASILNNILPRMDGETKIVFDEKNVFFTFPDHQMVCRLTGGQYPNYNSVIPSENPNKLIINREEFLRAIRRVGIYSNQASNLISLNFKGNQLTISAQDIDFSIFAYEKLACQYEGDELEIGFKSTFLSEILSNLSSTEIVMELTDASRAGIILPAEKDNENEDVLMLLMPISIEA